MKQKNLTIWVFPKIGGKTPKWFTMENPIQMDELGVFPLFSETSISSPRSLSKEFLEIKKLFGQDLLEGGQVTWDKTCRCFFQREGEKKTARGWSQERSAM